MFVFLLTKHMFSLTIRLEAQEHMYGGITMYLKTLHQMTALAVLIVFVSGIVALGAHLSDSPNALLDGVYQEIVVQPGDSLWAIARTFRPQEDPRDIVGLIRELNGLREATVYPGQRLVVPIAAN